jgi:PAS domain S-box-containing protein
MPYRFTAFLAVGRLLAHVLPHMLHSVALLYCSEGESTAVRQRLGDSAEIVSIELDAPLDERFDLAIIGELAARKQAIVTAVLDKLGGRPLIALASTTNDAGAYSDEVYVLDIKDLHQLPYIITRERRLREAELLLRRSERRYHDMVEDANEGLWIVDATGKTTFANRKMATLLGSTVPEVIGASMLDFIDDEWRSAAESALERRRLGIAETHDLRFRRPNGSSFYATVSSKPMYDELGHYAGASLLVIDITARRQVEEALLRRETELSIANELAQLGSWEWDFETNRIIGSRELFRLLGLGDRAGALEFEEWLTIVDRQDVAELREALQQAAAEGREFEHEYRLRGDAGRIIHSRGRVIADDGGAPKRMIGMAQDVTQLLRDAEDLRRSEHRFRALVEQATDIIFSLDDGQRLTSINPAFEAITGWKIEEWIGRPLIECLAPESHEAARAHLAAALRGESTIAEYQLRTRDGGSVTIETTTQAIANGGGELMGTVGIARDVTRRNEIERALEQEKRLSSLGHLAASVAHEFNNVLMSIMPFAELLKRRAPDEERTSIAANHIFHAIRRGRQISQEILRFARPAALVITSIDVRGWLRDFAREAEALVGPKYRVWTRESNDPAIYARADRAALDRVVTNLVLNARDAMPDGGSIMIDIRRSESDAGFISIALRDEGSGISPDVIGRVFDPLFTTKQGGTGLGLSTAYAAVTQMGGMLRVESRQGEGSEFTILLRIGERPAIEEASKPRREVAPQRVLLVEDDEAVGEGIRTLLVESGFVVHLVVRGKDAAGAVAEFNPDVVVLDVNLPDISGLEVLETLRGSWPALPVILSTGHADATALDSIRKLQVPFLLKPYEIGDLLALLARIEIRSPVG